MRKMDLNDLSAIQQKREANESQKTLEQSKKQVHICCPFIKAENYHCSICNRLRNVCPANSHQNHNQHASSLFSAQQFSMYNRRDAQSFKADRLRTFSLNESVRNPEVSRQIIKKQTVPIVWQKNTHTSVTIPQAQQIIYYPVIHNIIKNKGIDKSWEGTPVRKSKRQIVTDVNEKILTPTQFKQLLDSFRLQ